MKDTVYVLMLGYGDYNWSEGFLGIFTEMHLAQRAMHEYIDKSSEKFRRLEDDYWTSAPLNEDDSIMHRELFIVEQKLNTM